MPALPVPGAGCHCACAGAAQGGQADQAGLLPGPGHHVLGGDRV